MKVIARVNNGKVLCEVTDEEIEKFHNLYYGKMRRIEVGQEFDLGIGHDFSRNIESEMAKLEAITVGLEVLTSAIKTGRVITERKNNLDNKRSNQ